jgi:hypothetical protein
MKSSKLLVPNFFCTTLPKNSSKKSQPTRYPSPKHTFETIVSFQGCRMGVRHLHLHQQGCYAPQLSCVPGQVPGPLCHHGWRYSSRGGEDKKSGLLQASSRCCVANSWACCCRGASYRHQRGRCWRGAQCRPMGYLLWWVVQPCTTGGLHNCGAIVQALSFAWLIQWSTS